MPTPTGQPDAGRLNRIRDRAALRWVRGAAPVDPLVYARDVEYLLAALAAETTRAAGAVAARDEALARLGEAEALGRSEGRAEGTGPPR
jgi:hypothetical protein